MVNTGTLQGNLDCDRLAKLKAHEGETVPGRLHKAKSRIKLTHGHCVAIKAMLNVCRCLLFVIIS